MKTKRIFLLVLVAGLVACKKTKPSGGGGTGAVPKYIPTGFDKLRLGMDESAFKATYPDAKTGLIPQMIRKSYDNTVGPLYNVPIKGDDRFHKIEVCFYNGKLLFMIFVVHPNKCDAAFVRGMGNAMSKKVGKDFRESGEGDSILLRAYLDTDDLGSVFVGSEKGADFCSYIVRCVDWEKWKKKSKVSM